VSSCTTPNFPYRPFSSRRIKGYDLLADYLWPAPPKDTSLPAEVEEEVLMPEEVLLGKEIPAQKTVVDEATEEVDPAATTTSTTAATTVISSTASEANTAPATSGGEGEAEPSVVPLPTDPAGNESAPKLEDLTPEPEGAEPPAPAEFMLFLGDFVYADVPVWWGDSQEAYRRLYRRTYNSPR
jgi:alkaline phosphatase D